MDYDDDSQEQDEAREEIKHSDVMLGEDENKVIEDFLSFVDFLCMETELHLGIIVCNMWMCLALGEINK